MTTVLTDANSSQAESVRRLIDEVFNHGNLHAAESLLHPDYAYTSPRESMIGMEAFKAFAIAFREAFPDLRIEIVDTVSQPDAVWTRLVLTGTHQGDFLGLPATGQCIKVSGVVISHFQDGKIIREWELLDDLAMQQQLGLLDRT